MNVGILVVSDRVSRGEAEDKSGPEVERVLREKLFGPGNESKLELGLIETAVVADEVLEIQKKVMEWSDRRRFQLILTTGGTGFAPRDVTPEAVGPLLHKEAPGLVTRMITYGLSFTHYAMLSRPVAGVRGPSLIVTLPGSPKAARENLEGIIQGLPHALQLLANVPTASMPSSHYPPPPVSSTPSNCQNLYHFHRDKRPRLNDEVKSTTRSNDNNDLDDHQHYHHHVQYLPPQFDINNNNNNNNNNNQTKLDLNDSADERFSTQSQSSHSGCGGGHSHGHSHGYGHGHSHGGVSTTRSTALVDSMDISEDNKGQSSSSTQSHDHTHSHGHDHGHGHSHGHGHGKRERDVEGIRRESSYAMISVEQALSTILEHSKALPTVTISVGEALGRILSSDVVATEPLPPFRASVKDGYAVVASDGPGVYPIAGVVTAGSIPNFTVQSGTIGRITTGSALPDGADAIVMVEDTVLLPATEGHSFERVKIEVKVKPGTDIRPIGCDVAVGQVILKAGQRITPAEIGLLATVGISEVNVYGVPSVAVLSTGDELVPHNVAFDKMPAGCIRDSNRPMLFAAITDCDARWGSSCVDLGIARDMVNELETKVIEGLDKADVLITSGGVSMGELDLMKPLLERLGTVHFGRVEMKPGKPLTFATVKVRKNREIREKLVFALPGNPVSSLVTFHLFALPALRKLAGYSTPLLPTIQVKLSQTFRLDPERPDYQRAVVRWDNESKAFVAASTGVQASCRLLSMQSANVLVVLPKGEGTMPIGTLVNAMIIGKL